MWGLLDNVFVIQTGSLQYQKYPLCIKQRGYFVLQPAN